MKSCILLSISCLTSVMTFSLLAALTSQSYSQNGLIGQWDGIENAGVGQHDATATTWKDLTGMTGDFTLTDGVASFTADGLKKIAKGYMARGANPGNGVRVIEVVLSGVQANWVNAVFVKPNQTVTVKNGSTGDQRNYFFDSSKTGALTADKPDPETVAVVYNASYDTATAAYANGAALPTGTEGKNSWGGNSDGSMTLGGRVGSYGSSNDTITYGYTIHAIRLYNRELTEAEIARHAKIDQIRFFGAPDGNDGMAYIQDGLIGWWDGVENAGMGLHDSSTNRWVDLTGGGNDFLLPASGMKFEVNGLHKTAAGVCATNRVRATDVLTIEEAVSGIPSSGWVNAVFLGRNQTITFRNEENGRRQYFFDNNNLKWNMAGQPDEVTVSVTYADKDGTKTGTAFYLNGALPDNGEIFGDGMYWTEADGFRNTMTIGGRKSDNGDTKIYGYTVHGLRFYDRQLTAGEVAYNHAVDLRRYHGRSAEGFAYRLEGNAVECQLRAWTYGLGGTVKMGSGDPVADRVATEWTSVGTPQTATFTAVPAEGWVFLGWSGDVEAITSGTASDPTVTVSSVKGVALQAVFTLPTSVKYAKNGLIGWWDAKENAGFGHYDQTVTTWKDLTGETGDFELTDGVASFTSDGLKKFAKGVMAKATRPSETIRTVEAVVSGLPAGDSWANVFFANNPTEDYKNMTISVNNRGSGKAREYFFDYKYNGWKTFDKPETLTIAAIFNADATALRDDNSAFCNGTRLSGDSAANTWDDSEDDSIIQLGGRWGAKWADKGDANGVGYTIHAIRIYNRELSAGEIRRNAKQDAIRYFGATPEGMSVIIR